MYMGGATFMYGLRWYETQTTFNYWFGKIEFERRVARHQIWTTKATTKTKVIVWKDPTYSHHSIILFKLQIFLSYLEFIAIPTSGGGSRSHSGSDDLSLIN